MIHLFLDDSGKESQATNPWVCMAGYLIDYDALLDLQSKWAQLLFRHKIPEIHMKQLIPLTGMYEHVGWDHEKRDSVIQEFVHAINTTPMSGVGVAVEMDPWRKWTKARPELPWGTAQQFCCGRVVSRIVEDLHSAGWDDTLVLVFDTDPEFGKARLDMFGWMMAQDHRARRLLSAIIFGHPYFFPGLQAADLLAWQTRKELMQKREGRKSTRRWQAMLANMPNYHLEYTMGERWDDAQFESGLPALIQSFEDRGSFLPKRRA